MNKYRYLQSFELFGFISLFASKKNTRRENEASKIARKLDKHFRCESFSLLFEKLLKKVESSEDLNENLFLDFSNLDFEYTNPNILSYMEVTIIYTCISSWAEKYNPDFDYSLLKRILAIEENLTGALNVFLNTQNTGETSDEYEIFLLEPSPEESEELEGSWVDDNLPSKIETQNQFHLQNLEFPIKCLFIERLKIFLLRPLNMPSRMVKNGVGSFCSWEDLQPGDEIQFDDKTKLDYYDLKSRYLRYKWHKKLWININKLRYNYPNGRGLKEFSLHIESGWMLGLLGREGSGKSTLLQILAGELGNIGGKININGYDLKKDLFQLKGMIGYVPQDDLLFNELTVFENLFLVARLYLGQKTREEITFRVNKLLDELMLTHLRRTVVGSLEDKNLQPGQRRLLNIALEMLREPHILLVDNALAPLSSSDASLVIEILAKYTFEGKIVITSITQSTPETFLNFDRLFVIDEGGFPIYFGKTSKAHQYFKETMSLPVSDEFSSGADELLHLVSKKTRTGNMLAGERYKTPLELYKEFQGKRFQKEGNIDSWRSLPENMVHSPTLDRQYAIFSLRNFKSKVARTRELVFTIMVSPLLALIIATFLRESPSGEYSFHLNQNIPEYYFISLLFSVLTGLLIASNEIFKERFIIKKQEYLNLSRFSYINSKITFLLGISLIQTLFFVSLSSVILEIRSSLIVFSALIFSCQAFGVLSGLLLSATHKFLENLFTRSIPLMILLQALLGAGFVDLSTFTYKNNNYTPILADLIVTRWAYEGIMVDQYKNNGFTKHFYDEERAAVQADYYSTQLLPDIESRIRAYPVQSAVVTDSASRNLKITRSILSRIPNNFDAFPYENISQLTTELFNEEIQSDLLDYIEYLKIYFFQLNESSTDNLKTIRAELIDSLGKEQYESLFASYYNEAVAYKVRKTKADTSMILLNGIPVQNTENIFQYPKSSLGRTTMFLPEKKFGAQKIKTVEFNLSIIWLINLLLYVILVSNLPVKILKKNTI